MKTKLLILALMLFSSFAFAQSDLMVTEIMFDVPSGDAGDANGDGARSSRWDEFVEFYNNGTSAIDLSGYQIIEREGTPVFTFPVGATLDAGQFAVVFGGGDVNTFTGIPAGTLVYSVEKSDVGSGFAGGGKSNFSNSSDRVMIVDPLLADTLFEMYWGGTSAHPISPLSSKAMYLAAPYTISGDTITGAVQQSVTRDINGTQWDLHSIVTNDVASLFSPGENAEEQTVTADVVLTEIMFDVPTDDVEGDANGDGVRGSKSDEFIEIYNKGPIEADLTGFQLMDREGVVLYQFPDSTILAIDQFAVVFGAVGSAGFNGINPEAQIFAAHESDDNVGFDNGMGKSNLSRTGDAVMLVNSIKSDTLAEVYWGTAAAHTAGAVYLGPPNTISGDSIDGAIHQSVTHKLASDLWDLHTVVSGDSTSLHSPGLDAPKSPYVNTGDIICTEIMFDPPPDSLGDANGDGTRDSRGDEFVEFYNRGASAVDLSGYQILESNSIPVFTFPNGATINPGQFAVVFGNIRTTGLGANLPADAVYFSVTKDVDNNQGFNNGQGKSNLSQSSDAVILVNPANSDTLLEVHWGDAPATTDKAVYLGFPNTASGLTISGSIDQSVTRKADSDKWDKHTYITNNPASLFSPGEDAPVVSGIEKNNKIPTTFSLSQNYPNPFNPTTTIKFNLPQAAKVALKIYDILGREVAVLVNKEMEAGAYSFNWNAAGFTSGVYFYTITTPAYSAVKKMILVK